MRKLNEGQLETLKILYKFRFGSAKLIANYFNKNRGEFVHNRLQILRDLKLINKRFNGNYRLKGKPASYCLSPSGARAIQEHLDLDEPINLKTIYANKTVSEPFIEHCLSIFEIFNSLRSQHDDDLKFFTKIELSSEKYDYFPKPLPDVFSSISGLDGQPKRFFIEVIEDSLQAFVVKKLIKKYLDYEESGEWAATGKDFPTVLFVCKSQKTQKKVQKHFEKAIKDSWSDEIEFVVTTKAELSLSLNRTSHL